jgi:hypothetical protein
MNDRVVDRAAAHATPAELAIRDWLLVALSLATGINEAICFLTFGDQGTADNPVFHAWPRRVSIALAIALVLQAAFLVVWVTATSPAHLAYILMALSALALGLQANAIRSPYPASRSRTVRGCRPSRSRRSGSTPAKRPSRAAW